METKGTLFISSVHGIKAFVYVSNARVPRIDFQDCQLEGLPCTRLCPRRPRTGQRDLLPVSLRLPFPPAGSRSHCSTSVASSDPLKERKAYRCYFLQLFEIERNLPEIIQKIPNLNILLLKSRAQISNLWKLKISQLQNS